MAALPYSHLRGRDPQLAALDRHLSEADAGTGSVVIFEGGAGLGKTTLLRAAVATARNRGFRAGYGAADPIDAVVDLAVLIEALFNDDAIAGPLRVPKYARIAQQRFWLLQDIQGLLERAAIGGPVLVCLDDLQWADNGTAAALRSAAPAAGGPSGGLAPRYAAGPRLVPHPGRSRRNWPSAAPR